MATFKNLTINDTGFIGLPAGSTDQRPSASNGFVRYNTTIGSTEIFYNSNWVRPFTKNESNLFYYEGRDANLYTGNWNNSTTFSMLNFGGLGHVTAHGWSTGPATYTLTLNTIPTHNQVRYVVFWHLIDSLDTETSNLFLMNSSGTETEFLRFTKLWSGNPTTVLLESGATATWSGAKTYTHTPWTTATGNPTIHGYYVFDSGYYNHTSTSFTARHVCGADQAQADEAQYISHVQLWIK
jgi:hypothetical protein